MIARLWYRLSDTPCEWCGDPVPSGRWHYFPVGLYRRFASAPPILCALCQRIERAAESPAARHALAEALVTGHRAGWHGNYLRRYLLTCVLLEGRSL